MACVNYRLALRKLMHSSGLRQIDVARLIDVQASTVSRWLAGTDEPVGENEIRLKAVLDQHLKMSEASLIAEVNSSSDLRVLMDDHDNMLAMSKGFRDLMDTLGIRNWNTQRTDDGLVRMISVEHNTSGAAEL